MDVCDCTRAADRPRPILPVEVTTLIPVDRRLDQFCVVQWALPTPSRVELMANVVLFVEAEL